jgi:hypothetical protein
MKQHRTIPALIMTLAAILLSFNALGCDLNPEAKDPPESTELALIKAISSAIPDRITLDPTATAVGSSASARSIGDLATGAEFDFAIHAPDMVAIMDIISDGIAYAKGDIQDATETSIGTIQQLNIPLQVNVMDELGNFLTLSAIRYSLLDSTLQLWLDYHLNYYDSLIMDFRIKVDADLSGFTATLAMWEDGIIGALDTSGANRYWRITSDYSTGEASMLEFVREDEEGDDDFAYMVWHKRVGNPTGKMDYGSFLINDDPVSSNRGTFIFNRDRIYITGRLNENTSAIALFDAEKLVVGAVESPDTFYYEDFTYSTTSYGDRWPADHDDFYTEIMAEAAIEREAGLILIDAGTFFVHSEFEGF